MSLVLAASFAIGTGLNVAGFGLARDLGLGLVFVVWAGWSTWLAVLVWRRRPPFDVLDAVDASPDRRP